MEKTIIRPFRNLTINPFNSTLHYAIQCYEGMKAYKDQKGSIRMFRSQCNMLRFKNSSTRVSLPDFDGNELLKCIQEFVKVEQKWIPAISQCSMYIRPFHISMQNILGVQQPQKSMILVVASPVGAYYQSGFKAISILCDDKNIRSAHGGLGSVKAGGNYAPTIMNAVNAKKNGGHGQVLYLVDGKCTQLGTSNVFFVFKSGNKLEIVTPLLEDLILPGVTRDSIINLLKHKGYQVTEKILLMEQVIQRHKNNELVECFGTGTAVIVSPIMNLHFKGVDYNIPVDTNLQCGPITRQVWRSLLDIQQGRAKDPFNWVKIIN